MHKSQERGLPDALRSKLAVGLTLAVSAIALKPMLAPTPVLAQDTPACVTTPLPDGSTETDCSATVDLPSTTTSTTSEATTPAPSQSGQPAPSSTTSTSRERRRYSLNMHEWGAILSSRGCGIIALSNAVSYQRQKLTNPHNVWKYAHRGFDAKGRIKASPYMRLAAPDVAKHYDLKAHETSLENAIPNIEDGASVIMLAAADPKGVITHASHYFETDQAKDGKVHIHDPNQTSRRSFNDSWRSIRWLKAHHTLDRIWVIEPK